MIEIWLEQWVKNAHRLNERDITKACGVKAYGIEYRIMLEGGAVSPGAASVVPDSLLSDIDLVWHRIHRSYPDEMNAVKEYYKRGSYRSVRTLLGCSQHSSVVLVKRGVELITGGLLMLL